MMRYLGHDFVRFYLNDEFSRHRLMIIKDAEFRTWISKRGTWYRELQSRRQHDRCFGSIMINFGLCLVFVFLCVQRSSAVTTMAPPGSGSNVTASSSNTTADMNETSTLSSLTTTNDSAGITREPEFTTAAPSACPRFPARFENDNDLVISYIPGTCEMVVRANSVSISFPRFINSIFGRIARRRRFQRPEVFFRAVEHEGMPEGFLEEPESVCEELPMRSIGPFVFVDTVPEECQILLALRKNRKVPEEIRSLRGFPRRPGWRKPRGRGRFERSRVPVFQYLDGYFY